MHVKNFQQPVEWKRDNLESWRASHSLARQAEDRAALKKIFTRAAEVPVLKDALEWAQSHGIEFIVDHTTIAGGYYFPGSGVVGLSKNIMEYDSYSVGVLVHEIRHAWQDYYHMIPTAGKTFAGYFMREALIEADATAHQKLAERQNDLAREIAATKELMAKIKREIKPGETARRLKKYERRMAATLRDPKVLWDGFDRWYRSTKPSSYGDAALRRFAATLGVPKIETKNYLFEYDPYQGKPPPVEEGLDAGREGDLRRLGKTFNGVNYFNAACRHRAYSHDRLTRHFLSASAADSFYKSKSDPLLNETRIRQLRLGQQQGRDVLIAPPYTF